MFAGSHVELRAVQRTRDGVLAQSSIGEASVTMRTIVVEGEQFTLHPAHHDAVRSDVIDSSHRTIGEIREVVGA